MKRKLLITGVAGLVGSACERVFGSKGWEVIGLDNNARAKNLGTDVKDVVRWVDITDKKAVEFIFQNHQFDAIIHAAAQASHDWSNNHVLEDFDINARGTVILLEMTRKYCPNAVFVHVSTDKIYGDNMKDKLVEGKTRYTSIGKYINGFTEDLGLDFAGHRSPFGVSKTAGDLYAQEYAHTFGLKVGVFRPGCITGEEHEGAELHGFLAYLAKCIRTGTPYKIFGFKGKQVRDQIHADDLAEAFSKFIQNPRSGEVYNIGGGMDRAVSVLEAMELIEAETGKRATYSFHKERPGDRQWDIHDVSKFRKHYPNWEYKYSLKDIIRDVCAKRI